MQRHGQTPNRISSNADAMSVRPLCELGVSSRWRSGASSRVKLEPAAPTPAAVDEMMLDVQLRSPASPQMYALPGLAELVEEQLAPLYEEDFAADLENLRQTQLKHGMKLSLLVEENSAEEGPALDLVGFVVYKPWGLPRPGVSVGACGVSPRYRKRGYGRRLMKEAEEQAVRAGEASGNKESGLVSLRSVRSAVRFYERLGFQRLEESEEGTNDDGDDGPSVPMEQRCDVGSIAGGPLEKSNLDPWSSQQSRMLEDGPTWPVAV